MNFDALLSSISSTNYYRRIKLIPQRACTGSRAESRYKRRNWWTWRHRQ